MHVLGDVDHIIHYQSLTTQNKILNSLHPEWPASALDHVNREVAAEVQAALLALRDHATSLELNKTLRCDTTPEIAELAMAATQSGKLIGFRTARSYDIVRTKQEAAGFLQKNDDGDLHCIRGDTLYDDLVSTRDQRRHGEQWQRATHDLARFCSFAVLPRRPIQAHQGRVRQVL